MCHVQGSDMRCGVICDWLEGVYMLRVHCHDYPPGTASEGLMCARKSSQLEGARIIYVCTHVDIFVHRRYELVRASP